MVMIMMISSRAYAFVLLLSLRLLLDHTTDIVLASSSVAKQPPQQQRGRGAKMRGLFRQQQQQEDTITTNTTETTDDDDASTIREEENKINNKTDDQAGGIGLWPLLFGRGDKNKNTTKSDVETGSSDKEEEKKEGSPSWFGGSKKNVTTSSSKDKTDSKSKEAKKKKKKKDEAIKPSASGKEEMKKKRRGLFFQRSNNKTATESDREQKDKDKDKKERKGDRSSSSKEEKESAPPPPEVEQNATTTMLSAPPPPPPQSSGGVIVLGSPESQYRLYRRMPPQQQQFQRPPPGGVIPSQAQPISPGGVVVFELAGMVIGTIARLWFIRWLAGWLARQEESIQPTQHFVWERLNDRYLRDEAALKTAIQAPPSVEGAVWTARWRRHQMRKNVLRPRRRPLDLAQTFTRTVIVVELNVDSKDGLDLGFLQDTISFLLQQYRAHAFGVDKETGTPMELEVVFLVQSPGGAVTTYGLAAAQLDRLSQEKGITTTVCVDRCAASGGYMIASQSDKLIAAPFATVGSIGVMVEGLNFNEFAKRYGIQPLVVKSGGAKNRFTLFGPVTRQDLDHEQESIEKVHDAFKDLILQRRPEVKDNLNTVADGSVFLGTEALGLGLVDSIMTSSEYLLERVQAGDRVLKLHRATPARFAPRITLSPIDVLPHLQAWIAEKIGAKDTTLLISKLIQTGSILGFAHHILRQYLGKNQ